MIVSSVVGAFESVVAVIPIVMCFQSLILDMAGNVGTQSLAVTIRVLMDEQLTTKQKLMLVVKEMKIGFANGLFLGFMAWIFLGLYILSLIHLLTANPGGAPGNFLAALNKYGAKTAFRGKVGDDAFGKLLLKTFEKAGSETKGIVTDPSVFTTLAFVTFSPAGDRSFSFARKPGADTRLSFEEIDLNMIDESSVFHFGTLSLTDDPDVYKRQVITWHSRTWTSSAASSA